MKAFKQASALFVAFLLGCVAAPIVVPPLTAQSTAAGARRWEYQCIPHNALRSDVEDVNAMGAQGWEAVTFIGGVTCFKRPL